VDYTRVFVGSFNFDPRSRRLNTELGFIIDCPTLARTMSDAWTSRLAHDAYQIGLSRLGTLRWVEYRKGKRIIINKEPDAGWRRRLIVFVLSRLPIEWLL
jgi:putative cardiolipin synthase